MRQCILLAATLATFTLAGVARAECVVGRPPASLHASPFYGKYCSASGIPIVASSRVPDSALRQTARIVSAMVAPMPAVRDALVRGGVRVGIIAEDERTTDMPEYASMPPSTNDRARGLGGAFTSVAEENVLCYEHDRWRGENILVHELAHTIKTSGLERVDASFGARVKAAFDAAIAHGEYRGLYAGTNPEEYFAEGVQDYFGVHQMRGEHDVHTRDELRAYDPALFAILDSVFRRVVMPSACPTPELPRGWLRLRNLAGGALDVQNGGAFDPVIAAQGYFSGQMWSASPNGDGTFGLTTMFLGTSRALDTRNDGVFSWQPVMAAAGPYTGQRWSLAPVTRGAYRLTNAFLGSSRSLEARSSGALAMARSSDARAQLWVVQ